MLDRQVKTSFIPSKPIQNVKAGGSLNHSKKGNFLSVVTFIIFIATLIVAGATFAYKLSLSQVISKQNTNLIKIQESFNPTLINEALRLNNRIESVGYLLEKHTSPSQIFMLLEEFTLETVQFKSLSYNTEQDGQIRINIGGLADSFRSVVLQSDSYGNTGYLRDVLFTNLQPNEQNNISFTLDGIIGSELVLYSNSLVPSSQTTPSPDIDNTDTDGSSFEFPESD